MAQIVLNPIDVEEIKESFQSMDLRGLSMAFRSLKTAMDPVNDHLKSLKELEKELQYLIAEKLEESGTTRATFDGVGTVFSSTTTRYSIADDEKFYNFVLEEMEKGGDPTMGFSYLTRSVRKAAAEELLLELAEESLREDPFPVGSLEANLPHEDQLNLRMDSIAESKGIRVYRETKATVRK